MIINYVTDCASNMRHPVLCESILCIYTSIYSFTKAFEPLNEACFYFFLIRNNDGIIGSLTFRWARMFVHSLVGCFVCHDFLIEQEVVLTCSYRSTCLFASRFFAELLYSPSCQAQQPSPWKVRRKMKPELLIFRCETDLYSRFVCNQFWISVFLGTAGWSRIYSLFFTFE